MDNPVVIVRLRDQGRNENMYNEESKSSPKQKKEKPPIAPNQFPLKFWTFLCDSGVFTWNL